MILWIPILDKMFSLRHELAVTYSLLKANFSPSFIYFFFVGLSRCMAGWLSYASFYGLLLKTILCCFIHGYLFDVAQQCLSVVEDEVNKPDRPVPSGLVTISGLRWRWFTSWLAFPIIVQIVYGRECSYWVLMYQLVVLFFYVWPKPNGLFWRNCFVAILGFCVNRWINSFSRVYSPIWDIPTAYDYLMQIWVFLTVHVQEYKDMKGDMAAARRTQFSLVSVSLSRYIDGVLVPAVSFCYVFMVLRACQGQLSNLLVVVSFIFIASAIIFGLRLILLRCRSEDEVSFKVFYISTAIFLWVFLSLWRSSSCS